LNAWIYPYYRRYHPAAANLWVACGFRQWGMTAGTHAAHMLSSLITKGEHADASLYSPQRGVQVTAGAPKLVMDQINVGKHARAQPPPYDLHIRTHAHHHDSCDAALLPGRRGLILHPYLYPPLFPLLCACAQWFLDGVKPLLRGKAGRLGRGEARLVNVKGHNVAAYRDEEGVLHARSATCVRVCPLCSAASMRAPPHLSPLICAHICYVAPAAGARILDARWDSTMRRRAGTARATAAASAWTATSCTARPRSRYRWRTWRSCEREQKSGTERKG
jgi:hypothetical protein